MWQVLREDKQVDFMKSFVGQQRDLDVTSNFMPGNKRNTAMEHC